VTDDNDDDHHNDDELYIILPFLLHRPSAYFETVFPIKIPRQVHQKRYSLDCLTLDNETDRLPQNIGNQLPINPASHSRRWNISIFEILNLKKRYCNIYSQLDATITNFIDNYNQLNMFRAIISPILRSTRLCVQLVV